MLNFIPFFAHFIIISFFLFIQTIAYADDKNKEHHPQHQPMSFPQPTVPQPAGIPPHIAPFVPQHPQHVSPPAGMGHHHPQFSSPPNFQMPPRGSNTPNMPVHNWSHHHGQPGGPFNPTNAPIQNWSHTQPPIGGPLNRTSAPTQNWRTHQQLPAGGPIFNRTNVPIQNWSHHQGQSGGQVNQTSAPNQNWNHHSEGGGDARHWHHHHDHHNWGNQTIITPFYGVYPIWGPDYIFPSASDSSYYYSGPGVNSSYEDVNAGPNQYPNAVWVAMDSGNVPNNAIVYRNENGISTYYCRANYRNEIYYGELIPNDACYIQDQYATIRFIAYDVLVAE